MRLEVGSAAWVADRIPGCDRGFGENKTIHVIDGDQIIAGLVFHNWQPEAKVIEISSVAVDPRWMQRGVMRQLMRYPFDELKCQMVVARISVKNIRARRLWKALGSKEYIIPRLRGRNEGEAILTLTNEAWGKSKFMR